MIGLNTPLSTSFFKYKKSSFVIVGIGNKTLLPPNHGLIFQLNWVKIEKTFFFNILRVQNTEDGSFSEIGKIDEQGRSSLLQAVCCTYTTSFRSKGCSVLRFFKASERPGTGGDLSSKALSGGV